MKQLLILAVSVILTPFYVYGLLWLVRPILIRLYRAMGDGILKRFLFFSWKV